MFWVKNIRLGLLFFGEAQISQCTGSVMGCCWHRFDQIGVIHVGFFLVVLEMDFVLTLDSQSAGRFQQLNRTMPRLSFQYATVMQKNRPTECKRNAELLVFMRDAQTVFDLVLY